MFFFRYSLHSGPFDGAVLMESTCYAVKQQIVHSAALFAAGGQPFVNDADSKVQRGFNDISPQNVRIDVQHRLIFLDQLDKKRKNSFCPSITSSV